MVTKKEQIRTLDYLLISSLNTHEQEILNSILQQIKGETNMDFISAEEARDIARDAQRTIERQTIDELARTIHATAEAGKTNITFDKEIPPATLKNLRTLGYKIDLDYDYFHKMFYRISWEEYKQ